MGNSVVCTIQVIDVVVDAATGRAMLAPGLLLIGVAFLFGAHRLSDQPLWRAATWRD